MGYDMLEKAAANGQGLPIDPPTLGGIYLAGPDVFRPDAIKHGEYLKSLCHEHGFNAHYPFDNEIPALSNPHDTAREICKLNIKLLRQCSAVLANLNDFRGHEPDSGTCFEVGMAIALGKPVWAYFDNKGSLREQVDHDADGFDAYGLQVEDFGLPRNLMLACTWAGFSHSAEVAVAGLSEYLRAQVGCALKAVMPGELA